ncbi:major facilitator transporter, partial [Arthrobacter nitrophenolicus]
GTILCITAPTLELLVTGRFLQGVSSAVFALAYIVLNENLQVKVFGTSVGIIAAINGGIGGVDGWVGGLMAETLGFRSIFVVVLVLTAVAALCILRLVPAGIRGAMGWWGFTPSVWPPPTRTSSKGRMCWMPMRGSMSEMKRPTPRRALMRPSSSSSMRASGA